MITKAKDIYNKDILLNEKQEQVMMEWEKPYMEECINMLQPCGHVLEIGFGLGYSANQIRKFNVKSHTIIESDDLIYNDLLKWADDKTKRQLAEIRQLRLERLRQTDYLANSDVVMPENIKTWRQSLRDLPQDNTTEEQYDLILARDINGNLTNAIWSKP